MYCSTCGARVPTGRRVCDTCGTAQLPAVRPFATIPGSPLPAVASVQSCPRCGYEGLAVSYFSRGSRLAALVGVTMLTAGVMGAGGLIYYLMRKDHLVCARCGHHWTSLGARALARVDEDPALALSRGSAKKPWAVLLFVMAVLLMVPGIVEFEMIPLLFGMAAAGGGFALLRSANREREERRAALVAALQGPVLRLAAEQGGSLTVTEVAARLGWTMPRAEKVLRSLDDGLRVDSEVTDEGIIVYHFLELSTDRRLADPGA